RDCRRCVTRQAKRPTRNGGDRTVGWVEAPDGAPLFRERSRAEAHQYAGSGGFRRAARKLDRQRPSGASTHPTTPDLAYRSFGIISPANSSMLRRAKKVSHGGLPP